MDKLFDKPDFCEECGENLDEHFVKCISCKKYMCYDCFYEDDVDHEYMSCVSVRGSKAKVLDLGEGGYGPGIRGEWPSRDIRDLTEGECLKCDHALSYLETNHIIFRCLDCRMWVCLNCLDQHLEHHLMLLVKNENVLREVDPNLYKTDKELSLSVKSTEFDNKEIKMELYIINDNDVPLYDLKILYTWDGLNHDVHDKKAAEMINDKVYLCNTETTEEIIKPKEKKEITYNIDKNILNQDTKSIISVIRYKDVFLSTGRTVVTSQIENR